MRDLGLKAQHSAARRLDRDGRRAAAQPRRRGGRRDLGALVFGRSRHAEQQALRRRHAERLQRAARAAIRPACTSPASASRRRSQKLGGKADDRKALAEALHEVSLTDTPRGPVKFDHLGNVVGDVFIRNCERKDGKLVNTVIKTYPNVSQFWTYDEKAFLAAAGLRPRRSRRRRIWSSELSRHVRRDAASSASQATRFLIESVEELRTCRDLILRSRAAASRRMATRRCGCGRPSRRALRRLLRTRRLNDDRANRRP